MEVLRLLSGRKRTGFVVHVSNRPTGMERRRGAGYGRGQISPVSHRFEEAQIPTVPPPKRHPYNQWAPDARALDLVGDKWTLLIIRDLVAGPRRFVELQRVLPGISTEQLRSRLNRMVADGLLTRQRYREVPPRVDYELTERSRELETVESEIAGNTPASTSDDVDAPPAGQRAFEVTVEGEANGLSLTLEEDGRFAMQDRTGASVEGDYAMENGELVLSNPSGRLGAASFPMTCPVEETDTGLSVGDAEGCMISGLDFERAE